MKFFGREKETRQIQRALERGENVILCGKYGIGRTSLIRHVAEISRGRRPFIFLDFSQTPGQVCSRLMTPLLPEETAAGKPGGYRHNRFRIVNLDGGGRTPPVLVLDNIGKLSPQKIELIRSLAISKRFRMVAVVENFLPAGKFSLLRAWLHPAILLNVSYLKASEAREFFRHFSEEYHFLWGEEEINSLAEASGGYLLGMKDVVNRKLARSGNLKVPGAPL